MVALQYDGRAGRTPFGERRTRAGRAGPPDAPDTGALERWYKELRHEVREDIRELRAIVFDALQAD